MTRRRLKHGVFRSVVDLQAAINRFIAEYNANDPKPFIWNATQTPSSLPETEGSKRWNQSTSMGKTHRENEPSGSPKQDGRLQRHPRVQRMTGAPV